MTIIEDVRALVAELEDDEQRRRAEKVTLLLEHYQDVVDGLQDGAAASDDVLALMCEAWNHPAYQQLERLRLSLADDAPELYRHVALVYVRAERRMVAYCPSCQKTETPKREPVFDSARRQVKTLYGDHKHGGVRFSLQPRVERVVPEYVDAAKTTKGLLWIERQWQGEVFIPEDILAIEGRRQSKRRRAAA